MGISPPLLVTEHVYTYDLDRLVGIEEKVDGVTTSTKTLTYDGAGNLITDGEFTYTCQMGKQLQGITGTDLTTSYKYNENGLRTEKNVNGQTHEYTLLGSSVTREVIRDSAGKILWAIHYSYAGDSTPVSMNVNGTEYYYLKNAQGDITHIVDSDGNEVASYEYDALGNHLKVTGGDIAELNPYRYRGYRYDSETGLFYVGSRYYDPVIGRFINADSQIAGVGGDIRGYNMFAYCFNNPVSMSDTTGEWPFFAITAAIGAVAGAVVGGVVAAANGKSVLAGAAIGAAAGALIGTGVGMAAGMALAGSITASTAAVMAGGSALAATMSAGGLGAGVMYVAENVSRAVNSAGTALYSGGEKALQAARDSGGKVINDSIGKAAEIIIKDMPWEQAKPVWESFSAQFCQQASGMENAYVSLGAYQGPASIFWSIEMPALLNNPRVTEIVIHIFE